MMHVDAAPVVGWEAITTTSHPQSTEHILVERLWGARDVLIEADETDQDVLQALARLATHLAEADECTCVLPEQSCPACQLSARAVTILAEMGL